MENNKILPKVTVVTVTYNCVDEIEKTINSVLSQDYINIEYIIVDGKSTDGTLQIISNYKTQVDIIISELDQGLYDAMNKGIFLASGKWITFMNAGDEYSSTHVISDLLNNVSNDSDFKVIYGNTAYVYKDGTTDMHATSCIKKLKWTINRYQPYTHQAVLYNIECKNDCYYDINYKIAADYDVACRYWNKYKQKVYKYVPIVVCKYKAYDGVSSNPVNIKRGCREKIKIKIKNKMNIFEILKDIIRYLMMLK